MDKLLNFQIQKIDVFDQAVFILTDMDLHDEEINKINIRDPLTEIQRQSVHFLSLMMMVHPDQADTNSKNSRMTCRSWVKLPLYLDEIDASINNQIIKTLVVFYYIWRIWKMG